MKNITKLWIGLAGTALWAIPSVAQPVPQTEIQKKLAAAGAKSAAQLSPDALARVESTIQAKYGAKAAERKSFDLKVASPLKGFTKVGREKPFSTFETDAEGNLKIEIVLGENLKGGIQHLKQLGVEITLIDSKRGLVVASAPSTGLDRHLAQIVELPFVQKVRPITGGRTFHGSVLSEGDDALLAAQARADLGVDGTGVSVCVISDGIENAAAAAFTGDLPVDGTGAPAIETCPLNDNSGDEGTAMLEIIHDLAPGAALGFCPAFGNGESGLAAAIDWLANQAFGGQGCDIIADDVAFLSEPYFQDGVVAQAIDAVAHDVAYFNAAGNSAEAHYQRWYNDENPFDDSSRAENLHNFGTLGDPDSDWNGRVGGSGTELFVFLQWEEAFGASALDFDLFLFDIDGRPVGDPDGLFPIGFNGLDFQNGDDDPFEVAGLRNTLGDGENPFTGILDFFIVIVGPGDDTVDGLIDIELFFNSNNNVFTVAFPENYVEAENSIFGGAAAEGSITVAATGAVVNQGGQANPDLDIIQPFSSNGPVILSFDPTGEEDLDIRFKPDITAVDGTSVTGAGGFPSPFFGTSAAAPHAAAVAALVQEAGGGNLAPDHIRWILQGTAAPRGDQLVWGAGLIDALAATSAAQCW